MKINNTAKAGLDSIPPVILIVGSDASGKDHVAEILQKMIHERGGKVQKRRRYLSGKVSCNSSSGRKTFFELFLERIFLFLYPCGGWMIPTLATTLLQHDVSRMAPSRHKCIVVGHNCLRGLAFYWGYRYESIEHIPLSLRLLKTLRRLQRLDGLHVVVLSVDTAVRNTRIESRSRDGLADHFDYHMLRAKGHSERIEAMLVWLCCTYLDAQLIENNDLSEKELRRRLLQGFQTSATSASGARK